MLYRQLHRSKAFELIEEECSLQILRTNDLLQNRFGRLFRAHGITSSQYNVLRILRGAKEAVKCSYISQRMIQVVPAITGLLDRLEKQNLITRIRGDKDRRAVLVELSEEGEVLLEKLQPEIEALHQSMFSHMETEEMKRLAELLEKVRSAWVAPISARTNNKE